MDNSTFNLSGQIFTFDKSGYKKLLNYLKELDDSLSSKEEKIEILEDIKSQIAEFFMSKKENIINSKDVDKMIKEIGNFDEYKEIEKSSQKGFGEFIRKNWKKGCIILTIILLLLTLSFCALGKVVGEAITINSPLSWFYEKADEMFDWFYTKSDQMQENYDKRTEDMYNDYEEKSDEIYNDYKEKSDEIYNDYEEKSNEMLNDFEEKSNEIDEKYDEAVNEMNSL